MSIMEAAVGGFISSYVGYTGRKDLDGRAFRAGDGQLMTRTLIHDGLVVRRLSMPTCAALGFLCSDYSKRR